MPRAKTYLVNPPQDRADLAGSNASGNLQSDGTEQEAGYLASLQNRRPLIQVARVVPRGAPTHLEIFELRLPEGLNFYRPRYRHRGWLSVTQVSLKRRYL